MSHLRILDPSPLEHLAVAADRTLLVQGRRGDRLVTRQLMVVTIVLVVMVVGKMLGRHVMLVLRLRGTHGRRWQVHVTAGGSDHCAAATSGGSTQAATGIAAAGPTDQDTTTAAPRMVMMCRVNLGRTINLLWKATGMEEKRKKG